MEENLNKKRIIFTGGGSGGHVVPAITLIEKLRANDFEVVYFGSYTGIESKLTKDKVDCYIGISTGKLRRYISVENAIDLFKVALGLWQSFFKLLFLKKKPMVVFSMGGFVSVPVVVAAKIIGAKIFIHEQTTRVGLANKIASKFADKVFVSFEDSLKYFPKDKTKLSGYPVRDEFFSKELREKEFKGIDLESKNKPLLFITGGGNGSYLLNKKVEQELSELSEKYNIVHQVGSQFIKEYQSLESSSYKPVAFVGDEMSDLMKSAKIILSRSGAGTVAELMALSKPSIFIPLKIAQKNEQYHNAMAAHNKIGSLVITEDDFEKESLSKLLERFEQQSNEPSNQDNGKESDGTKFLIEEVLGTY